MSLSIVFGRVTTLSPARCRRNAFFWVPPPPMHTSASSWWRRQVSTTASVMSRSVPSTGIRCGLSRLVPRIVPPSVRIPESIGPSSSIHWSCTSPRKPLRNPIIRIPNCPCPVFARPRIAALSPGQSPPLVRTPMCRAMSAGMLAAAAPGGQGSSAAASGRDTRRGTRRLPCRAPPAMLGPA